MPTAEYFDGKPEELEKMVKTLDSLIKSCEAKGIATDYETAVYTALKWYDDNVFDSFQLARGLYTRAAFDFEACKGLYEDAKGDLEAYLAGTKEPFSVPRYKTSQLETRGKQFYADVEENGVVSKQPAYLSGFGHWLTPEQLEQHGDLGGNMTQFVVKPSVVLRQCETGYGFELNPDWATDFRAKLDAAEKNNTGLIIGIVAAVVVVVGGREVDFSHRSRPPSPAGAPSGPHRWPQDR